VAAAAWFRIGERSHWLNTAPAAGVPQGTACTPVHYEQLVREPVCTVTLVHYEQSVRERVCTGTLVHYEQSVRERVPEIARRVIKCILNPHLLRYMSSCDVVSNIYQTRTHGGVEAALAAAAEAMAAGSLAAGAYTPPIFSST